MRTIAVINAKGGSGKTTTALCLAFGLARRGVRTLLVDADAQGNATMTALAGATPDPPTLGNVLLDQGTAEEAIRPTRLDHLDVLPADGQLADAALLLADRIGREYRLRDCARRPGRPVRRRGGGLPAADLPRRGQRRWRPSPSWSCRSTPASTPSRGWPNSRRPSTRSAATSATGISGSPGCC